MVPQLLTFSNLPSGARYEVWHTPEAARIEARYQIYYIINGVVINKTFFNDEISAREAFERKVEAHS